MSTASTRAAGATSPSGAPPVTAASARARRGTRFACRALDLVLAVLLLIALLPVLAVIAVAIQIDSPGGAIFRQRRLGRDLRPFTINKFRTMRDGAGHDSHRAFVRRLIAGERLEQATDQPFYKIAADDRVTRVGRLLRRSSLDELPQLWNVVRGEMSLVGPRPPLSYEVEHYAPHCFGRFAVKPGLTGLWQVSGRSQLTFEEMIALDLEYAEHHSLWLNIRILARTVPTVLLGRGAA